MTRTLCLRWRAALLPTLAALAFLPLPVRADWTRLTLSALTSPFDSFAGDQLPDGRLVFGTKNALYEQTTFGLADLVQLGSAPTLDPSDLAIYDAHLGVAGAGGPFGQPSSPIYQFDPSSNPASSATYAKLTGPTLQNYSLVFNNATSLLVGGLNGTGDEGVKDHAIVYEPLQAAGGAQSVIIVDHIAPYSGGFNLDLAGNLYVVDPSDFSGGANIYEFSAASVASVIAGASRMTLANGVKIGHTDQTASLVVDALGRIWTAGSYAIEMYDPATNTTTQYTPEGSSYNYRLSTFTLPSGASYISYLFADPNQARPAVIYGYDLVQNIPEPTGGLLLASGLVVFALRRRHAVPA